MIASSSVFGMAWRQARMVERTVERRSSSRTAFLLPDMSDHFSPPVIASRRKFTVGVGCGDRLVSCCMVLPFRYKQLLIRLSPARKAALLQARHLQHSTPPFSIFSWSHSTITTARFLTQSNHSSRSHLTSLFQNRCGKRVFCGGFCGIL